MIEIDVMNFLESKCNVPVFFEHPEEHTEMYVVIQRTGSTKADMIERPVLAIQSCANSLYDAAVLNESVKAAMGKITDETVITSCNLNTDYNFTNTAKKQYRYQAVYQLNY